MNPAIDLYLNQAEPWRRALEQLRMIALECGLDEDLKWGSPCYAYQQRNVLIIGKLKDCCVLSFFKGSLLSDIHQLLIKPGEQTQAARLIKFTNVQQILTIKPILKAYIHEAMAVEKLGMKVDFKASSSLPIPEELEQQFIEHPNLKIAFNALTPGRKRGYLLHFSNAKQIKTKLSRIEKCIPQILKGKGFNEE